MNILITGGAGYIGSTVANLFLEKKHKVTIIDNLSTGNKKNIPKKSFFYNCDISNEKKIKKILKNNFDVVLHFAAFVNNEESINNPKKYFVNNYEKSKIFLNLCLQSNLKNFVYSSTAAVYGQNKKKVFENSKINPLSPYAKSKYKFEKFLLKHKKELNFVILRYFNVGGVEKKMRSGFNVENKSLISNLCKSIINNKKFLIYGNTHKTKDGTAIRDFIYISDLAKIHYKFSLNLIKKNYSDIFNCGYGRGISVKKMYNIFSYVSKKSPQIRYLGKRKKDISISISSSLKLKKEINVTYSKKKLLDLAKTSIDWYKKQQKLT